MDYKKAVAVLMKMSARHSLDAEEKEAVLTAVGVLDWVSFGKKRVIGMMKARKENREKL